MEQGLIPAPSTYELSRLEPQTTTWIREKPKGFYAYSITTTLLRITECKKMSRKTNLSTVDIALTGVFCAVWAALNLILGPLSFQLLQLPILHDFAVYFTLLLTVWATGRFGTSSLVGIIGTIVAIFLGGPVLIICFAASAVVFDLLLSLNHHNIRIAKYNLAIAAIATVISAYVAGILIGVLFTPNQTLLWALTFWGGWHAVGGIMSIIITFPIIISLEKANVRGMKPVATKDPRMKSLQ